MFCLGMWWGFAIAQVGLKSNDPHVYDTHHCGQLRNGI